MEVTIWDSSLDLSPDGVDSFCNTFAAEFYKTPEELKALPLMDLAIKYMWQKRSEALRNAKDLLDHEVGLPIVVFSDLTDFMDRRIECTLLESENLKDIFQVRCGLSTRFYLDGQDLRCDDLTEDGMNYHIFRAVRDPRTLGEYAGICFKETELPNQEILDRCSRSLAPEIEKIYAQEPSKCMSYVLRRHQQKEKELQR